MCRLPHTHTHIHTRPSSVNICEHAMLVCRRSLRARLQIVGRAECCAHKRSRIHRTQVCKNGGLTHTHAHDATTTRRRVVRTSMYAQHGARVVSPCREMPLGCMMFYTSKLCNNLVRVTCPFAAAAAPLSLLFGCTRSGVRTR